MALSLESIRVQHTLMVLQKLWKENLSRAELARRIGLSRSAISSIITELIEANLVSEMGFGSSTSVGGRKPELLRLRSEAVYVLAMELGAQHLRLGVLDLSCDLLFSLEVPHSIALGPQATYQRLQLLIADLLSQTGLNMGNIAMCGLSLAGPVDVATGRMVYPPNMPGWNDEAVATTVATRLGKPSFADNDANLAALAEANLGAFAGSSDLIYLKVSSGIGAGLFLRGKLYRGMRGGAGEIGHISINETGPKGRSGNPGSLEAYISPKVIVEHLERWEIAFPAGQEIETLAELARNNDPRAVDLWLEFGRHLGVAVSSMLNLYNPAVVLIGGRMTSGEAWLRRGIEQEIEYRTLLINRQDVQLAFSSLGRDASLLGTGMMLIGELLTPTWLEHLYLCSSQSTLLNKGSIKGSSKRLSGQSVIPTVPTSLEEPPTHSVTVPR